MEFKSYHPFKKENWTGRTDSETEREAFRFHQVVKPLDLRDIPDSSESKMKFCLLGFASDEGIVRNKGRKGAAEAPHFIRRQLANLPANFIDHAELFDAGDIGVSNEDLESAQFDLSNAIQALLSQNFHPLVLGGGHEIVLGHFNGVDQFLHSESSRSSSPLIVNFDAHFDLRPISDKGSSGTMFRQIAQRMDEEQRNFDYLCIGLQTYANTRSLYNCADELGVKYFHSKDISHTNQTAILEQIIALTSKHKDIYLTLDFDVLNAANAPGVSAPQPFGMDPELFLYLVKGIIATKKVRSLDIAEISPRFDDDNRTSKLAAVTLFAIINELLNT